MGCLSTECPFRKGYEALEVSGVEVGVTKSTHGASKASHPYLKDCYGPLEREERLQWPQEWGGGGWMECPPLALLPPPPPPGEFGHRAYDSCPNVSGEMIGGRCDPISSWDLPAPSPVI